VIVDPPLVPAVNATVNEPSPVVTELIVGAPGAEGTGPHVMTRLPVPLLATATNSCAPAGPPQVTERQSLLPAGVVSVVQVMPVGLVMTRFPSPLHETAMNFSCPAGPSQVTNCQSLSAAEDCAVQVMPVGLVMTRLPVPE